MSQFLGQQMGLLHGFLGCYGEVVKVHSPLYLFHVGSIILPDREMCQNVRKPFKTRDISSVVRFMAGYDLLYKINNLWGYLEVSLGRNPRWNSSRKKNNFHGFPWKKWSNWSRSWKDPGKGHSSSINIRPLVVSAAWCSDRSMHPWTPNGTVICIF